MVMAPRLFLAGLLDALRARVERSFALAYGLGKLRLCLLVWIPRQFPCPRWRQARPNVPAASLALYARSSSSSSCAFFLGFLLWIGLVPAGAFSCQPCFCLWTPFVRRGRRALWHRTPRGGACTYLLVRKASWRCLERVASV